MKVLRPVLIIAMLALAAAAPAQTLYKSVMPDGRVVYGDDPEYNARRVGTVKPPPAKTGTVLPTYGNQSQMLMSRASTNGGASVAVLGGNGSGGRRPSVKYCP